MRLLKERKRIYAEGAEDTESTEKKDRLGVFVEPVEVGFGAGDDG